MESESPANHIEYSSWTSTAMAAPDFVGDSDGNLDNDETLTVLYNQTRQ